MSKLAHIANITWELLQNGGAEADDESSDSEEEVANVAGESWVGRYSIYRFLMQIDNHYCETASSSAAVPTAVDAYVGPGCPAYLVEIAPGYVSDERRRKCYEG